MCLHVFILYVSVQIPIFIPKFQVIIVFYEYFCPHDLNEVCVVSLEEMKAKQTLWKPLFADYLQYLNKDNITFTETTYS